MAKKRVEIRVYGFVQGVNFRYYTIREAQSLNLTGFVKNEPDDSVLIVAEGEEEDLEKLINWSKKGPSSASVDKIEINFKEPKDEFERFEIKF